ncbi:MCE family protein [Mycolicibacterium sp. XJ1819]
MRLDRKLAIQLTAFSVIAVTAISFVLVQYMELPTRVLGFDRYDVTLQLQDSGALYANADVTYRGVSVGRVTDVSLTDAGAQAVLLLDKGVDIPADLTAEVRSMSAVGEQFVELTPRSDSGPVLKGGDVIPADRVEVPPNINALLAATNRGLNAIPRDDLKTVVDEAYTAFGGLGPELSRVVDGMTTLATGARENLDSILTVIDEAKPILDSQIETADSVQAWTRNVAEIETQFASADPAVRNILQEGPAALDEARQLFDRLQPTLPTILANLVSVGEVALTYHPHLESVLTLVPVVPQALQGSHLANRYAKPHLHRGMYLSFNLNLNWPPPCTTGFYPAQQQRWAQYEDPEGSPGRPPGDVYCRVPQDSPIAVRGARNIPCATKPGKRAPTVKMCESDEEYIPLNDGWNWKGDPNATMTGQDIPQFRPGEEPPAAPPAPGEPPASANNFVPTPIPSAAYDPATGTYVGPDGQLRTQSNLANGDEQTWQQMLIPPTEN